MKRLSVLFAAAAALSLAACGSSSSTPPRTRLPAAGRHTSPSPSRSTTPPTRSSQGDELGWKGPCVRRRPPAVMPSPATARLDRPVRPPLRRRPVGPRAATSRPARSPATTSSAPPSSSTPPAARPATPPRRYGLRTTSTRPTATAGSGAGTERHLGRGRRHGQTDPTSPRRRPPIGAPGLRPRLALQARRSTPARSTPPHAGGLGHHHRQGEGLGVRLGRGQRDRHRRRRLHHRPVDRRRRGQAPSTTPASPRPATSREFVCVDYAADASRRSGKEYKVGAAAPPPTGVTPFTKAGAPRAWTPAHHHARQTPATEHQHHRPVVGACVASWAGGEAPSPALPFLRSPPCASPPPPAARSAVPRRARLRRPRHRGRPGRAGPAPLGAPRLVAAFEDARDDATGPGSYVAARRHPVPGRRLRPAPLRRAGGRRRRPLRGDAGRRHPRAAGPLPDQLHAGQARNNLYLQNIDIYLDTDPTSPAGHTACVPGRRVGLRRRPHLEAGGDPHPAARAGPGGDRRRPARPPPTQDDLPGPAPAARPHPRSPGSGPTSSAASPPPAWGYSVQVSGATWERNLRAIDRLTGDGRGQRLHHAGPHPARGLRLRRRARRATPSRGWWTCCCRPAWTSARCWAPTHTASGAWAQVPFVYAQPPGPAAGSGAAPDAAPAALPCSALHGGRRLRQPWSRWPDR